MQGGTTANDSLDASRHIPSHLVQDHPLSNPSIEADLEDDEDLVVMSAEEIRPMQGSRSAGAVQNYASAGSLPSSSRQAEGRIASESGQSRDKLSRSNTIPRQWSESQRSRRSHDDKADSRTHSPSRPPFLTRNARSMRLASQASIGTGLEGRPGSIYHDEENVPTWRATAVGATPLDRTMDAIGMGRYQYAVLVLSGLGWAADNMWLQGVAIVLPRVQDEWGVRDQWIGLVSSSTFAGMMIGALAWGTYADTFGRKNAFNMTLLITAIFGLLSSFAPTFPLLCLCLFLLGTGVGGSMPTDGTIFLEALPKRNHYLLTALSVFFAAGSVVTSLLAYFIVPQNSCGGASPCDVNDNKGWRYLLSSLGGLTLLFVIARLLFFTLFESPKYLVSAGKHEEARDVLQRIAAFNGQPKRVRLSDVSDIQVQDRQRVERHKSHADASSLQDHRLGGDQRRNDSLDWQRGDAAQIERQNLLLQQDTERDAGTRRHSFGGHEHQLDTEWQTGSDPADSHVWPKQFGWVPLSWRASLHASGSRYAELLSPYWRKTTLLVWAIWTVFTLAYTMVNVFLPKYLENRSGTGAESIDLNDPTSRTEAMRKVMREFLFYTMASLPGSLMGAYLIETPLGRIKSMALSTFFLGLSLVAFAMSYATFFVILTSCSISLFASIAYAVIYSYSPEVFKTKLRGTASGTASALSRLAGIVAPVLAGLLMQVTPNTPLYVGFALFAITVWLQLSLPFETRGRDHENEDEDI